MTERSNMGGGPGFFVTIYNSKSSDRKGGIAHFKEDNISSNINLNCQSFVYELDLDDNCDLV